MQSYKFCIILYSGKINLRINKIFKFSIIVLMVYYLISLLILSCLIIAIDFSNTKIPTSLHIIPSNFQHENHDFKIDHILTPPLHRISWWIFIKKMLRLCYQWHLQHNNMSIKTYHFFVFSVLLLILSLWIFVSNRAPITNDRYWFFNDSHKALCWLISSILHPKSIFFTMHSRAIGCIFL